MCSRRLGFSKATLPFLIKELGRTSNSLEYMCHLRCCFFSQQWFKNHWTQKVLYAGNPYLESKRGQEHSESPWQTPALAAESQKSPADWGHERLRARGSNEWDCERRQQERRQREEGTRSNPSPPGARKDRFSRYLCVCTPAHASITCSPPKSISALTNQINVRRNVKQLVKLTNIVLGGPPFCSFPPKQLRDNQKPH